MGWLHEAMSRGVQRGIQEALDSDAFKNTIDGIVRDMLAKPEYAFFVFIKHIQAELMRVDPKLPAKEAMRLAKCVYSEHLADSRVEFGHPDYTWDRQGAIELAHAYEIDHWETVA